MPLLCFLFDHVSLVYSPRKSNMIKNFHFLTTPYLSVSTPSKDSPGTPNLRGTEPVAMSRWEYGSLSPPERTTSPPTFVNTNTE